LGPHGPAHDEPALFRHLGLGTVRRERREILHETRTEELQRAFQLVPAPQLLLWRQHPAPFRTFDLHPGGPNRGLRGSSRDHPVLLLLYDHWRGLPRVLHLVHPGADEP